MVLLYVLLHAVVSPILCGVATFFLIERQAGEARGLVFMLLTTLSFALSLLSVLTHASFRRSRRKIAHLALTISGFAVLPLLLFGGWVLIALAMSTWMH